MDESYVGGTVRTLDAAKLEEVMRNRSGTMLRALEGQRHDAVRVLLMATDE